MDLINSTGLYESSAKNLPEKSRDRLRISGKELVIGQDYDRIDATYPTSLTERYEYSKDSSTVFIILITYLSAAKKDISSVEVI